MQESRKYSQAYLTVYLALTMTVLFSLCLTLIDGARRSTARLEIECVADIGLNSAMAEYHRELFNQYNLFAIDSSYGTAMAGVVNTERHLQQYLERNLSMEDIFLSEYWYRDFLGLSVKSAELTKVSILTDGKGSVFRRRAIEAIQDDAELSLLQELREWVRVVEANDLENGCIEEEKEEIDRQIQEYDGTQIQIAENKWTTVEIDNPTNKLEENRKKGVLSLVVEEPDKLSDRKLNMDLLIAARMEQGKTGIGNMKLDSETEDDAKQLLEKFLFQEYLLRYMGHYGAEKETAALQYQVEYLVAGKDNDIENLKSVVNRLLLIRETANALYLFSDSEKCMEAELVATAISSLLMVPEIMELLKVSLLLGWAYAESVYDVKLLLAGGRVPLLKEANTWHYGLQGALQADVSLGNAKEGQGLSYEDYLRIFMMCMETDTLTARGMNMIEADIRLTPGNLSFRLDGCFDGIEACIGVKSGYGYTYEITRQKIY